MWTIRIFMFIKKKWRLKRHLSPAGYGESSVPRELIFPHKHPEGTQLLKKITRFPSLGTAKIFKFKGHNPDLTEKIQTKACLQNMTRMKIKFDRTFDTLHCGQVFSEYQVYSSET